MTDNETRAREKHGPDWSDWQDGDDSVSCRCGFNGPVEECAETRAREELAHAELVRIIRAPRMVTNVSDGKPRALADDILREFDAVAGLLGYVKADETQWGLRDPGDYWVSVQLTREDATRRSLISGRDVVRRHVTSWEVVSDADTQ